MDEHRNNKFIGKFFKCDNDESFDYYVVIAYVLGDDDLILCFNTTVFKWQEDNLCIRTDNFDMITEDGKIRPEYIEITKDEFLSRFDRYIEDLRTWLTNL